MLHETDAVTREEVANDVLVIHDFFEYIRWLADTYEDERLDAVQVWRLFVLTVREGRAWSETCEALGLPVREDWA